MKAVVRFPKIIMAIWIIVTFALGYFALDLPSKLQGNGFNVEGENNKVNRTLEETFNHPKGTIMILFEKETPETNQDFESKISRFLEKVNQEGIASEIRSPLENEDLNKDDLAYAVLQFDHGGLKDEIDWLRSLAGRDGNVSITGAPVINEDINHASQEDLKRAEMIGIPVALVVLLMAFGSIVASLVPLIIGAITVIASLGILTLMGDQLDLSVFILNIVPMIGLALSIDFSLLFINRYREELEKQNKVAAILTTIRTAGRSIMFSAFCVFIGLAAMTLVRIDIFQNIAIGGMIVVALSVISANTLLPAILFLLDKRINQWMIIKKKNDEADRWQRFAEGVMRRPIRITLLALGILAIGTIPITDMKLKIPEVDSLPTSYESRQAMDRIEEEFGIRDKSTVYVIAERSGDWLSEEGLEEQKRLEEELSKDPIVEKVDSIFHLANIEDQATMSYSLQDPQIKRKLDPMLDKVLRGEKLLIPVTLFEKEDSEKAQDWVREWSQKEWDYDLSFGGKVKFNQEIFDEINNKILYAVLLIVVSTYFILMIAFRSVIIPLKAILMNIIGLAATFGILVWLFQGGHLGLTPSDIALIIPVMVFSLVFGLSMDYEVFLISRIHEHYLESKDNHRATVEGLATTSRIITSAALIMIVITGAFAFTGVMPVKQIGVGIAIAITIDATIIRLLLVPSLMKLLGDWNWWMPFIKGEKAKQQG
ncbi:MMPL family transporter [Bacillaceae bacterium S4-13-58]